MLRKLEMRIDIFFQDKRREAYRRAGSSAEAFFRSLVEALQEFEYQVTCYYESLPPVMRFSLNDLEPCPDELRHSLRWRICSVQHDACLPALYVLLHNDVVAWSNTLVDDLVALANACLKLDIFFLKTARGVASAAEHVAGLAEGGQKCLDPHRCAKTESTMPAASRGPAGSWRRRMQGWGAEVGQRIGVLGTGVEGLRNGVGNTSKSARRLFRSCS